MVIVPAILSFIVSFLIVLFFVPLLCTLARRYGIVDIPDGKIKRHEQVTPYLGGVAVYSGFILGISFFLPLINRSIVTMVMGTTVLLLVGLLDDIVALTPSQKIIGQIVTTCYFLYGGFYLQYGFFQGQAFLSVVISFLWILSIVNAFNLVDIMDGLATTIAVASSYSFFLIALLAGDNELAVVLASFLGALVAFLWYNLPPAKIYLGDAGSLFVGGILATAPFLFSWSKFSCDGFVAVSIILGIPLLEVFFLVAIRTYKGLAFYRASPDHFAIFLMRKGWTKLQVLLYVSAVSCVLFAVALSFLYGIMGIASLVGIGILFLFSWFSVLFS